MILENSKLKQHLSLFIFLFVNFMFSVKYISRATSYYLPISILIVTSYFLIWKYHNIIVTFKINYKKWNFLVLVILLIFSFFIFYKVPKENLNVDRWSVITTFWDNFFNDKYVYFARSFHNNPPGPMPFYFILALPFYLIGELGLFSLLGIILFYFIIRKFNIALKSQFVALLLIVSSLFYLWEIVSRSNIFLNGVLVLFVILYILNQKVFTLKKLYNTGILTGLVLSTRNVFIIPFVILFIYLLNKKIIFLKDIITIGIITVITFWLTFAPFVWNHSQDFMVMNPFIIQSSGLMPFKYTLVFIFVAFIFGFICKSKSDIVFFSGLILFISICLYFFYWFFQMGFEDTFFNSGADISYFILGLPFSIFHLLENEGNIIN